MGSVANVKGIEKLSQSDLETLDTAAKEIGVQIDWLATVISFESGFSPSIQNKSSKATGLIQVLPITASNILKLPKEEAIEKVKNMSFSEQLKKVVIPYFSSYKGRMHSLDDTYLAVFYPAAIGKSSDTIIAVQGQPVYDQNSGFDKLGLGYITKSDITSRIRNQLNTANASILFSNGNSFFQILGGLIASAFMAGVWYNYNYHNTRYLSRFSGINRRINKEISNVVNKLHG